MKKTFLENVCFFGIVIGLNCLVLLQVPSNPTQVKIVLIAILIIAIILVIETYKILNKEYYKKWRK